MSRLIRNALRTPDGTIIESLFTHDFVTHKDKNGKVYMVDGGLDYFRASVNGDEIYLDLYDDQPHEFQREYLRWGTYGKKGDRPIEYKKIKDMSTNHMEAVLRECSPSSVIKKCMQVELKNRL